MNTCSRCGKSNNPVMPRYERVSMFSQPDFAAPVDVTAICVDCMTPDELLREFQPVINLFLEQRNRQEIRRLLEMVQNTQTPTAEASNFARALGRLAAEQRFKSGPSGRDDLARVRDFMGARISPSRDQIERLERRTADAEYTTARLREIINLIVEQFPPCPDHGQGCPCHIPAYAKSLGLSNPFNPLLPQWTLIALIHAKGEMRIDLEVIRELQTDMHNGVFKFQMEVDLDNKAIVSRLVGGPNNDNGKANSLFEYIPPPDETVM